MKYLTKSPKETEKLAGFLLKKFLKNHLPTISKKALVIALEGELGAGKTTFTRGLADELGVKTKIKSPTFSLLKQYKEGSTNLYHFDCYRFRDHRDLKTIGIKEILNNSNNILLIEWSDRVKKILPKNHIKIHIDHIDMNTRKINVSS